MENIMEKIARADRMLAAISVSGDNVLLMTDARRELGEAYRMMSERNAAAGTAENARKEEIE